MAKKKSSFDSSKDMTHAVNEFKASNDTLLEVTIKQYDKGEMKVQVSRFRYGEEDKKVYVKLGRYTAEELLPLAKSIIDMEKELKRLKDDGG